ncbi:MAG: carbohydrate ABC transporter permease [Aggregatilineales bacterium]
MRAVTLPTQIVLSVPRRRFSLGYLLVAPLVLWLVLTVIVPLIGAIGLSMQDMRIIGTPSNYVGLENYGRILGSEAFWAAAGRSLIWVVGNAFIQTALGFIAALLLNQRLRLARMARTWILLSWVIPTAVLVIIWRWMLSSAGGGLINALLLEARLIRLPISFFGSAESAMLTLILINSWRWFPLTALFVLAGLQAIPDELYEAAKVDGASAWGRFRFITLPSLQPVLASLGVIGFLWSVNVFDVIWLLTQGGPSDGTTTLPVFIYNAAFKQYRLSEAAAASVIFGVLLLGCAALFLKFIGSPERER